MQKFRCLLLHFFELHPAGVEVKLKHGSSANPDFPLERLSTKLHQM
jgi:hypothetical protein